MKIDLNKRILVVVFLLFSVVGYSQENSEKEASDMYSTFHKFFYDEIRRQGIKGNWIFQLNEITGLHTFDMNSDGLKEVLFEFDAVPEEGKGTINSYAALFFETEKGKFQFKDYIETPYKRFLSLEEDKFRFFNRKKNLVEVYVFEDKRFKKIKGDF